MTKLPVCGYRVPFRELDSLGNAAPDPAVYLERYAGYSRQRQLGLISWLAAGALRAEWLGQHDAASDRLAILMMVLEQAALDGGSFDVAWLLALEEEPPATVFSPGAPAMIPRSVRRGIGTPSS